MTDLKILVTGYARVEHKAIVATPNTVLLKSKGKHVLVDPGSNRDLLLEALDKEALSVSDIDIVFVTHYHLDHTLNVGLFPEAELYDGDGLYRGDTIIEYSDVIPGTSLQVLFTPGHTYEHWSLIARVDERLIGIAGDVFWWWDHEEQESDHNGLIRHIDESALDMDELMRSRQILFDFADYIIPGHGKPFEVLK